MEAQKSVLITTEEIHQFQQLLDSLRDEFELPALVLCDKAVAFCTDHSKSMAKRKRLTVTRSFGAKTLRHFLEVKPIVNLWLVGQGTNLIKNQFIHWASAPDSRGTLLNPRIKRYGIARCDAYWTLVAYAERSNRDHRKKV